MFNHQEAQKSLSFISDTVNLLNRRRLELDSTRENIKNNEQRCIEIQKLAVLKKEEVSRMEERVVLLDMLGRQKERELEFIIGRASEKELAMLNSKNRTSIEYNRTKFLREIRNKTNEQLKQLEQEISLKRRTRSDTKKAIELANKELEEIQEKSKAITTNLEKRETQLKREKEAFIKEVTASKKWESYLNLLASRLKAFAKENHLNFKI